MTAKRDGQALVMFLGGQALEAIRDRLGMRSVTQAEAAIRRALAADQKQAAKFPQAATEIARIDKMYARTYQMAVGGDLKAVETCLKLSAERAALMDDGRGAELEAAYDETVKALKLKPEDASVVMNGRTIARQIDWTLEHGTSYERTKALYLMPHLMNVLRELGASPAARNELTEAGENLGTAKPASVNPLAELQEQMKKRQSAG